MMAVDLSWTEQPKFQSFIGGVIAFNSLLMGLETDIKWDGWFYIEQVLLCVYVFELGVSLKRKGLRYFSWQSPDFTWNYLDFTIVTTSVGDSWVSPALSFFAKFIGGDKEKKGQKGVSLSQMMMLLRMLRLMRILRLVKLVKSVRPLFILVTGITRAFQGVVWVMVLTVGTLYAAGIVATRLIGHKDMFPPGEEVPDALIKPFMSVSDSMFTLFRVMNGAASEMEEEAIDGLLIALPQMKFAFVFFMVGSSWFLLSILTSVVNDSIIASSASEGAEQKLIQTGEDRVHHLRELSDLFKKLDTSGEGILSAERLRTILASKEMAWKISKVCRVPVRDIMTLFQTVCGEEHRVRMEDFVESMLDVGKAFQQKDVMKLESKFMQLEGSTVSNFFCLKQDADEITDLLDEFLASTETVSRDVVTRRQSENTPCAPATIATQP